MRRSLPYQLFDQAAVSIYTFLSAVLIARSTDVETFGAFAVAYTVYLLAQGSVRSLIGDPLLYLGVESRGDQQRDVASALRSGLLSGAFVSGLCIAAAAVITGPVANALIGLAIVSPFLIAHDVGRYSAFHRKRPVVAAMADTSVLAIGTLGLTLVPLSGLGFFSPMVAVLAWGLPYSVTAIAFLVSARAFIPTWGWIHKNFHTSRHFLVEQLSTALVAHTAPLIGAAFQGPSAAAALRGAGTLLGPVGVAYQAIVLNQLVAGRSHGQDQHGRRRRTYLGGALLLGAGVCALAALVSALPSQVGVFILGESWSAANAVLIPSAVAMGFSFVLTAAGMCLRLEGRAARAARIRVILVPVQLGIVVLGAATGTILTLAWAMAGSSFAGAIAYVVGLYIDDRRLRPRPGRKEDLA